MKIDSNRTCSSHEDTYSMSILLSGPSVMPCKAMVNSNESKAVPFVFRVALPSYAARRAACRAPEHSKGVKLWCQKRWGGCERDVPSRRGVGV